MNVITEKLLIYSVINIYLVFKISIVHMLIITLFCNYYKQAAFQFVFLK